MTELLPRPKLVLFDWDNTLVTPWPALARAVNAALVAVGRSPVTQAIVAAAMGQGGEDPLAGLDKEAGLLARQSFTRAFAAEPEPRLEAVAGALDVLGLLTASAIPVAILCNRRVAEVAGEAEALGLSPFLAGVVGVDSGVRAKPSAEGVALAIERLGLLGEIEDSREIWLVGDTDIDLVCAHAAGATPILLRESALPAAVLEKWPPAIQLSQCEQIIALLAAIL
ncbi:HAD family hydrolase [Radicibacter daui]|uniref:HAD family hydrolase n=1 Tax=Radicibacter daui TaxID=3064829 RepID=UPI004046DB51